jgi:hypothetical protein
MRVLIQNAQDRKYLTKSEKWSLAAYDAEDFIEPMVAFNAVHVRGFANAQVVLHFPLVGCTIPIVQDRLAAHAS